MPRWSRPTVAEQRHARQEIRELGLRQAAEVEQREGEAGFHRIAGDARRVALEGFEATEGAVERGAVVAEGRAVAGDHGIDVEAREHRQRLACRGERAGPAEQFAEDDAEAVLPERVAGDQQALPRAMENQRFHVVAGRGDGLPDEAAHLEFLARRDHAVVAKAVAALRGRAEQQRLFVPVGDVRFDAGGNEDLAAEGALHGRVAADVVGVRMGVDQTLQVAFRHG